MESSSHRRSPAARAKRLIVKALLLGGLGLTAAGCAYDYPYGYAAGPGYYGQYYDSYYPGYYYGPPAYGSVSLSYYGGGPDYGRWHEGWHGR